MTKATKPSNDATTNVTHLQPLTSNIEPEKGWELHSKTGFMRCGPELSDRLVSLHDVTIWLMCRNELPLVAAVERICSAFQDHGVTGVHFSTVDAYATPIDEPSEWDKIIGLPDGEDLAKTLRAVWLMPAHQLERLVNTPGFKPSYNAAKESPFDYSNRLGSGNCYAITFARAHALWGWGSTAEVKKLAVASAAEVEPQTWTELVVFRSRHRNTRFLSSAKRLLVDEFKRRNADPGATCVAAAMAKELGISVSRFNEIKRTLNSLGKRNAVGQPAA